MKGYKEGGDNASCILHLNINDRWMPRKESSAKTKLVPDPF
jgi:hypothetical protein